MTNEHIPVLLKEVVEFLNPQKGKKYIDATLGFGGHSVEIIKRGGQVLGIEWDPKVLQLAKKRLIPRSFSAKGDACPDASRLTLVEGNFADIKAIGKENNFALVDGILFDLGISFWHYKKAKRGFSFNDQKLDMRLNPHLPVQALEVINCSSYDQLYEIFTKLAQERLASPIARALVRARRLRKINSATGLASLVEKVYRQHRIKSKFHPATKVFLAVRTVVNQELKNLEAGLAGAIKILKPGAKLAVITFNSNEDRIVKNFLKKERKRGAVEKLPLIFPGKNEVRANPLARSAKLRTAIKQ